MYFNSGKRMLSFVDTHICTLLWGQEQLCHDVNRLIISDVQNFIGMLRRYT